MKAFFFIISSIGLNTMKEYCRHIVFVDQILVYRRIQLDLRQFVWCRILFSTDLCVLTILIIWYLSFRKWDIYIVLRSESTLSRFHYSSSSSISWLCKISLSTTLIDLLKSYLLYFTITFIFSRSSLALSHMFIYLSLSRSTVELWSLCMQFTGTRTYSCKSSKGIRFMKLYKNWLTAH